MARPTLSFGQGSTNGQPVRTSMGGCQRW